ncbi:MAG: hypothetical protein KatS3mg111_2680 [Pirellulaceae bacterium]|nr:MAG: hypothetical protein KatS3mg111_2680 [Pirellulaceae bacterium]
MHEFLPPSAQRLVVSYIGIRRAIGLSGMVLPVMLGPGGWLLLGIEIQDNMSSYYHTPLRDLFVGTLCAMGVFLFCYRGHDWIEDWTANLGCFFALAVAFFPLDPGLAPLQQDSWIGLIHCLAGGGFFLTLAFYSLVHFPSAKEHELEPEPHIRQRDRIYRASGIVIVIAVVIMGGYLFILPAEWKEMLDRYNALFWLEWIALWAFSAAWLTKGRVIIADVMIDLLAEAEERLLGRQ